MKKIIVGKIISIIFMSCIISYYSNTFKNQNLTVFDKIFGWIFQEYIKSCLSITTGKYYIINKNLKFLFYFIEIIKNITIPMYINIVLELIIFICLIFVHCYIIFTYIYFRYNNEYNYTRKDFFVFFVFIVFIRWFLYTYSYLDMVCFIQVVSIFLVIFSFILNSFIILFIFFIYFFKFPNIKIKILTFKYLNVKIIYNLLSFVLIKFINFLIVIENIYQNNNFYQEFLIKSYFLWIF